MELRRERRLEKSARFRARLGEVRFARRKIALARHLANGAVCRLRSRLEAKATPSLRAGPASIELRFKEHDAARRSIDAQPLTGRKPRCGFGDADDSVATGLEARLQVFGRGQEFVLDLTHDTELTAWMVAVTLSRSP